MKLARSPTREPSHKPHIYKPHHLYVCFSHNARGEGNTMRSAFKSWEWAQQKFERNAGRNTRGFT